MQFPGPPSGPIINRHTLTSGSGIDPYGNFPIVAPGGGSYSFKLGNDINGAQAEKATYVINVPVGANNYSFQFKYAVVFEDPQHPATQQPRFEINIYDALTLDTIPCAQKFFVAGGALPGFTLSTVGTNRWYKPWSGGTIDLSGQAGKSIIVEFATGDCSQSGHFGYGYFDLISCGAFEAPVTSCDLEGTGGVTFTAPPGFASYTWFTAGWTQVGTGQIVTILPPLTPTYYNVVMVPFPGNGCNDTVATGMVANIAVNATPDTLCLTGLAPVQLNAGAAGGVGTLTYSWTPANSTLSCTGCPDPIATPGGSQTYIVQVTDTNGCWRKDTLNLLHSIYTVNAGPDIVTCIGTPVTINASVIPSSTNYQPTWTPGTGLSSNTAINPVFTPTTVGTTTYVFRVDSSACSKYDTMTIQTLPNNFNVNDTTICKGIGEFQITASGDPIFTYRWTPGIGLTDTTIVDPKVTTDTTRTYVVTASYPTCPDIVKTVTVTVEPVPTVKLGPDTVKCQWDQLFIAANIEPSWFTPYTYQWDPNSGINTLTSPAVFFTGKKDTFLILTVKTPIGCEGKDTINIMVREGNFASVTPSDTFICPRNQVQFAVSGGAIYNWVPDVYLDDPSSPTPLASPVTDIKYTVYVTDQYGCMDTVYSTLDVLPDAVLELGDSVILYPGESVQMDPKGNALYYNWFPALGLSKTDIANPIASPSVNTRYFVMAKTENGCIVKDSIDVIIKDDSGLDIPNAFSPGTAPNDVFRINKRGIATLKAFKVYNRWGNVMFETTNIDEGWDGTYKGKHQPMGVYIYMVDAITSSGRRFTNQGNVTLIR
jgi:gliding motility-associated-like protein